MIKPDLLAESGEAEKDQYNDMDGGEFHCGLLINIHKNLICSDPCGMDFSHVRKRTFIDCIRTNRSPFNRTEVLCNTQKYNLIKRLEQFMCIGIMKSLKRMQMEVVYPSRRMHGVIALVWLCK